MNTGEFQASITQMERELTSSRKKLYDKFEKLKSDFEELQKCIVEKNEQIAELKEQKRDMISLLDQAFAIIDDPSQGRLLDSLCSVESEVKTLIGIAKSDEQKPAGVPSVDKVDPAKPAAAGAGKADPGDDAKKWAMNILKGIGEAAETAQKDH